MPISALDRACEVLKTQDALAAALGIRSASISGWRERGKVPAERREALDQGGHATIPICRA